MASSTGTLTTPTGPRRWEGLGDTFYITKTSIKPHACCRYNQGPIDCVLQIVRDNGLKARTSTRSLWGS